jgi:hypothetical protein
VLAALIAKSPLQNRNPACAVVFLVSPECEQTPVAPGLLPLSGSVTGYVSLQEAQAVARDVVNQKSFLLLLT